MAPAEGEELIRRLLLEVPWRRTILHSIKCLKLPEAAVGAGAPASFISISASAAARPALIAGSAISCSLTIG